MEEFNNDDLKLIYIHKTGYNSKGEGFYDFIFSGNETNVNVEEWMWDESPACNNAMPPTDDYIDKRISLKTDSFDLFCLHEAVEREYMHGYHTIHALAYENTDIDSDHPMNRNNEFSDFDKYFVEENDDEAAPLLVFHYGMSVSQVEELFNERKIILKNNEFIESSSIEFN